MHCIISKKEYLFVEYPPQIQWKGFQEAIVSLIMLMCALKKPCVANTMVCHVLVIHSIIRNTGTKQGINNTHS